MKIGISDKGLKRIAQEFNQTLSEDQARQLEQEHNVYIDTGSMMYTRGEREDDYGWEPIPSEWLSKTAQEYKGEETSNFPAMLYSIPGEWGWWPDLETSENIKAIVEELNTEEEWDVDVDECEDYALEKVVGSVAIYRGFSRKNDFIIVSEDFDGNYKLEVEASSVEEALERIEEESI